MDHAQLVASLDRRQVEGLVEALEPDGEVPLQLVDALFEADLRERAEAITRPTA